MYGPIKVRAVTTSPFSHVGLPTFIWNDHFVTLLQLSISPKELAQDIHLLNIKKGWIVSIYPCLKCYRNHKTYQAGILSFSYDISIKQC